MIEEDGAATASKCPAAPWYSHRHKFEARYHLSAAQPLDKVLGFCDGEGSFNGAVSLLAEKSRSKTYLYDICTRCGLTVAPGRAPLPESTP